MIKEDIKEMENVLQNVLSPFTDINIEYEAWRLVEEEGWHKQIKNRGTVTVPLECFARL